MPGSRGRARGNLICQLSMPDGKACTDIANIKLALFSGLLCCGAPHTHLGKGRGGQMVLHQRQEAVVQHLRRLVHTAVHLQGGSRWKPVSKPGDVLQSLVQVLMHESRWWQHETSGGGSIRNMWHPGGRAGGKLSCPRNARLAAVPEPVPEPQRRVPWEHRMQAVPGTNSTARIACTAPRAP